MEADFITQKSLNSLQTNGACVCACVCVLLGIEPKTLWMQGQPSTTELFPPQTVNLAIECVYVFVIFSLYYIQFFEYFE